MKFSHLDLLVDVVAEAITRRKDEVFIYVGIGYVLDQDGLKEVIREALEKT